MKPLFRCGIRILRASIGIRANEAALLPRFPLKIEVPSLLTDFHAPVPIPWGADLDGQITLEETGRGPCGFAWRGRRAVFHGPWKRAESRASDARTSLWGNQGFLYRFALRLLEERHAIFSFHAVGLYDEPRHTLYVVAGGAGSGKTVCLLSGLERGLELFSTETVHFRFTRRGLDWFKGSLVDNVRRGTLVRDFPAFLPPGVSSDESTGLWAEKIAVDLSARQTRLDILTDPRVVLVFPRIEAGRPGFETTPFGDPRKAAKAVFDNLSQKIAETVVLDDVLAVGGLETPALAAARWEASGKLAASPALTRVLSVLSNPRECWGGLLE